MTGFAGRSEEEEETAFLLCRFAGGGIGFWDLWEGGGRTEGGETKKEMFISVDCVVVGGGISGLCIAQVLATKHGDAVPNVIVTETRDRLFVKGFAIVGTLDEMAEPVMVFPLDFAVAAMAELATELRRGFDFGLGLNGWVAASVRVVRWGWLSCFGLMAVAWLRERGR
ncbi:hypothetical protein ACFX12_028165 [Malus domestica]